MFLIVEVGGACIDTTYISIPRSGLRLEQGKGIPVPWAVGGSGWRAAILCNSARGVIPISHLLLPVSTIGHVSCTCMHVCMYVCMFMSCSCIQGSECCKDVSRRSAMEKGSLHGDGDDKPSRMYVVWRPFKAY